VTFLFAGIATSIYMHVLFLFIIFVISGLFAISFLSVCSPWFHNAVTSSFSHTGLCRLSVCLSVVSIPSTLHIYYYYYYYYSNSLQRMRWGVICSTSGEDRNCTPQDYDCYESIRPADNSFMALKTLNLFLL
jgi:hypothetical protein